MGAKYYESELQYLREMGKEFSLLHPSTAGLLAEKGSDPDVERLLEGVAFLTARIRERVDDAVPEVVHGLMQLLLPHYLRTIPPTSVIQYEPPIKSLRGVHTVSEGARVSSKSIKGTACEFRTTMPVDLLPVRIEDAVLDQSKGNFPVIRLRMLTSEPGMPILARKEGLRFLLHGELGLSSTLHLWLMRHLKGVSIQSDGAEPIAIGTDVIKPIGFRPQDDMLPWPTLSQPGYRYLQEYFCNPSKFLYFDLERLDRAPLTAERFEIAFEFERPPELNQRITAETFRLFTTPVINLFDVSAEPVKLDPKVHEHLLRASGTRHDHMEVYAVREVLGIRQGQSQRRTYEPFVGFAHTADSREGSYYTLRPTSSPLDDATDKYISIVTPLGDTPSRDEEVLSMELTCSNRLLPAELQLGEINTTPRGVSSPAPFKNISPVTNASRPKLGSDLQWRLLSHLSLGRASLADPRVLRTLLNLYNFQRESSPAQGRANELRVESIRSIENEPVTRLMGGAPVRGVETRIELEESKLGTQGDAFLFGCVLDEVFATHVPLNSFNELHLILHPSKVELKWPARSGQRRIL
ncbi:MAG: type VI secretion system baseplate subunit TssF [Nannocystales bacterium]